MTAPLTQEAIAARNSAAVNEVGGLFCELDAVLQCLDDAVDRVYESDAPDGGALQRLKGLSMAAARLTREIGFQVGAI